MPALHPDLTKAGSQGRVQLVMTRRSKARFAAAVLFSLVNLAGGVMAALAGELIHASVHAGLLLLGGYYARRIWLSGTVVTPVAEAADAELTDRLTHLELSVEAAAMAVERVGEGQRFMARFLEEHETPPAPGESVAESNVIKAKEETPDIRRP
ncbi:MAG TPA: hypothetical protein VIC03_12660 [Gemmatimonadaceae bacterium]|jgi:hypothetical protein